MRTGVWVVVTFLVACGGESSSSSGSGGAGSGAQGGSAGHAGSAGKAGSSSGTSNEAGASASAGEGGSSGASGSSGEAGAPGGAGSGTDGGAAGEAAAGGASGEAGSAGEQGGSAFPCGDATVAGGPGSGLESCSGGYLRRVGKASCLDGVPRDAPIPNYDPAVDECESDSDCSTESFGLYAHCGVRAGGTARVCVAGCTEDGDCETGNVCFCDEPVGRCVPAGCSTGDDCAPGFDCASYWTNPGCFSTGFACQTEADACVSSNECSDFSPNPSFCVLSGEARACSIVQCTTP